MIWPATWLAALAGLVLASIPGALLGALLGQVLDRRLALRSWGELYRRLGGTPALSGEELLFVALGRLAKADGRVQEQHIQQAREEMRRLELQADAQRAAIDAFARGKAGQDDLRRPLRRLRHQPDQARQLLQACVRMAQADRRLGGAEQRLLDTWRDWLGVPRSELDGLLASSRRGAPAAAVRSAYEQALQLLGVDSQADASEIKRAYRRQLSRCHPDKLTGSGATPAQIRAATEKTRELHAAYALLRQRQR